MGYARANRLFLAPPIRTKISGGCFTSNRIIISPVLNLIYDILTREDSNLSFPSLYHTSGEILIKKYFASVLKYIYIYV